MSRLDECLKEVLRHEGGWANHPKDPGGATNKGVTFRTFKNFYPKATLTDLRNISDEQIRTIYKRGYWDPIDGDGLGAGVDLAVFDLAVNSGVSRAKKMFRAVMKYHWVDNAKLINTLCDNRMSFLRGLNHWGTFGTGWTRRVDSVRKESLVALRKPDVVPVPSGKATTKIDALWDFIKRILGI